MLSRASIKVLLILLAVALYWAACLYPYTFALPRPVVNQAERTAEGTLSFPGPGLARTVKPLDWLPRIEEVGRLEVQVVARTHDADQGGPARILTISAGPHARNLTLGQQGADLVLRIRRPGSTRNGTPDYRVADVFRAPDWRSISVRVEDRRLTLAVDGIPHVDETFPRPPFKGWKASYPLAMGNEVPTGRLGDDRAWTGEIGMASVYLDGHMIDYLEPGATELPDAWWERPRPRDSPLDLDRITGFYEDRDMLLNLLGFMPFGALLMLLYGRRLSIPQVIAYGALLSLSIELLQVGIPRRHPSLMDLILNTVGTGLGAYFSFWAPARRLARRLLP
jgi:hypothetical protein